MSGFVFATSNFKVTFKGRRGGGGGKGFEEG
jgi:hypothetical protein